MKAPIVILSAILAALPATALAAPPDRSEHYAPPRQESHFSAPRQESRYSAPPQRSYQAQPRYSQPVQRYNPQPHYYQQPQQRYYQQPTEHYYQSERRVEPMPRYQSRTVIAWGGGFRHDPWYWHSGLAWAPAPAYWGGGFWGDFAIGLSIGSYNVQPDSPGAQLLANYGLTQGPCDQDNMVQIYGPDGSEICAYPNDTVAPGQYQIDMSTLSLVSM